MILTKKNISNILFNAFTQVMNVAFPILMFPYVTRILGVEGIGLANLALITSAYFATLASMGIPIYGIREVGKVKDDVNKLNYVISELLLINTVCCIISLFGYLILVHQIDVMRDNVVVYYIAMFNIILSFFQVDWIFQGLSNFKFLAIRSLIVKLLSLLLVYFLVKNKTDVDIFVFINVFALSIGNLINFYYVRKNFKLSFKGLNIKRHIQPIVYFFSSRIMSTVYTLLDSVILGILTSNYFVGLYTIAIKIIRVVTSLISSVVTVFFAESSKLKNENVDDYKKININLFVFLNLVSIPLMTFMNIYASDIVFLFSGDDFYEAGGTIKILSFLVYITIMTNFFGVQILYVNGKEKVVAISLGIGAVVCVLSNLSLVPLYKHNGAAISAVLAESAILVTQLSYIYKKKLMLGWLTISNTWKILLASTLYLFGVYCLFNSLQDMQVLYRVLLTISVSIPFYLLILVTIKEPLLNLIFEKIRHK